MKTITLILPILIGFLLSTVPCHAYRDLETGVFLSRDPAGHVDGPNVYTYVKQNPWTSFDPEGLQGIPTWETQEAISVNTARMMGGEKEAAKMHDAYAGGRQIAIPIVAAVTVGTAATVVTGGAAAPALTAMGVTGPMLGISTAVISGAAGSYAANSTSNVLTGRPVNEGGAKAAIYGAAAGAVLQTSANLGKALMEGWTGGAASARATVQANEELLTRYADFAESPTRLGRLAKESLANPTERVHGISTTAGPPSSSRSGSTVARSKIEEVFKVHDTPSISNPAHRTVEIPDPVTPKIAKTWNELWGFKKK